MKKLLSLLILLIFILALVGCNSKTTSQPAESTSIVTNEAAATPEIIPNADEAMAESKPHVFAKGIISTSDQRESSSCLAPDGTEFYFTRNNTNSDNPVLWVSKMVDGQWSTPDMLPFAGTHRDFNPFITNDNKYMLFYRVQAKNSVNPDYPERGTWICERTENGWSDPRFFLEEYCVTTPDFIYFYFTANIQNPKGTDIDFKTYDGEVFSELHELPGEANSKEMDIHSCISRDGLYLAFDSLRPDGSIKDKGMFIAKKGVDGNWGKSIKINEVIEVANGEMPSFSPNGKLLFFSLNDDIHWIPLDDVYKALEE